MMQPTRWLFAAGLLLTLAGARPALAQRQTAAPITNARQRLEIERRVASQEAAARRVLVKLASAEKTYKARYGTYVSLDTLQARKLSPFGENGLDKASGYRFQTLKVGKSTFTLHAGPARMTLARGFTVTEKGRILPDRPTILPVPIRTGMGPAPARTPAAPNSDRSIDGDTALRSLQALDKAEAAYLKGPARHYAGLDELKAAKLTDIGDGGVDPDSGYTFHSFPEEGRYVLLAIPPIDSLTAYLSDTGKLRRLTRSEALAGLENARRAGIEMAALQVLKSLRAAQEAHRTHTKAYTDLNGLKADGACVMGEGEREPTSGYRFRTTNLTADTYLFTATPPQRELITYTLDEKGVVTP